MNIIINMQSMIPIYEQLINQIKGLIKTGILKENDSLPSVRSLASDLKISALTVKKAYDYLEEEGIVKTIHGKGTYVTFVNEELIKEEQIRIFEEELELILKKASLAGISKEDIKTSFDLIMEDIK